MPLYTVLIKPSSSLCNMHCDYCFYCDESEKRNTGSYGMMSEKTLQNLIKKAMFQAQEQICFAFQGGEPTLRGLDFFRKAVELEKHYNRRNLRVMNTLQTNGLCLNEEWCRFFKENKFLIGVSVDGTETIHNLYRHDAVGAPSYERIRRSLHLLQKFEVDFNILTVVTRQTAKNIRQIYQEYKKNGWNYQQYIACLDPLGDEPGQREYSLTPEIYGDFLNELFHMWEKDWRRGKAPYIRQFENYISILLGYPPESCEQSGVCSIQCVAEADGGAYPCDFYVLDEYRLGNYNVNTVREMFENPVAQEFVRESVQQTLECRKCPWYSLCRCGCRRHRFKNPETGAWKNYFCDGYRKFFEANWKSMTEIADFLRTAK